MRTFTYFLALVGAAVGYIWGAIDGLFIALVIFITVDYITGVLCAIYEHHLSSGVGFKGIIKKIAILIMVAVANIIDCEILKAGSPCRTSVIFFYVSNEGISILENITRLGVPVPEKLRQMLDQLHEE